MLRIYKLLESIINPIVPCFADHYLEEEDKEKIYPHAVICITNSVPNNSFSDNNLLSINVYDNKSTDIREIETICDDIHKALNNLQYNDEHMNISIYRNTPNRLRLDDDTLHEQRRELRYIIKTYYKI